jgi:diacylglycerol kinase (ATP)
MPYCKRQGRSASRIAVIVNPNSRAGSRGSLRPLLERRFGSRLESVCQVSGPDEATALSRQLARSGIETLVAAGGDGTVNAVVNGMMGSSSRLGILPTGTANDLASSLRLPVSMEAACTSILEGNVRTIDVVRVNDWYFITAGGIGLPAHVINTVNQSRRGSGWLNACVRRAGSGLYALSTLYHVTRAAGTAETMALKLEDQTVRLPVYALLVANLSTIGKYMHIAPGACPGDGQLRVVVFAARSCRSFAAAALRTLNGSHGRSASVSMYRGRRLNLTTDRPTTFCADGELKLCGSSFDFEVIPGAIRVICSR